MRRGILARPGALHRILDYPLGRVTGQQALAVRTTDSIIHAWDLARAIGADDALDTGLVTCFSSELARSTPAWPKRPPPPRQPTGFFAAPQHGINPDASPQDRLLRLMGRNPERGR